jgi:hypothetical protein
MADNPDTPPKSIVPESPPKPAALDTPPKPAALDTPPKSIAPTTPPKPVTGRFKLKKTNKAEKQMILAQRRAYLLQ